MARRQPVKPDDRLTLVEHLDELRARIIFTGTALVAAFALCFWQQDRLFDLATAALPDEVELTTLGVTEPLFTTLTVAGYGAFMLCLPILFYQLYAFVIPAFTHTEKRVLIPYMVAMPLLFVAGIVFAYFVVLPAAIHFLVNYNQTSFDILVQASSYMSFFGLTLVALALCFQMPIVLLSLCRLGVVTPDQLAANRRYAIFVISVVAAALPGGDPVSMILIMIPLIVLYEASVILARRFGYAKDVTLTEPSSLVSS